MNDYKDSVIIILAASLLITFQTFSFLSTRIYQLTEDARATKLIAGCELWDIVSPGQSTRTMVLACPRIDAMLLWPLPVQQLWVEDG